MRSAVYGALTGRRRPPVIARPPLPAWDPDSIDRQSGAPLPVWKTLTARPPVGPDVRFMRADLWGTTLPGLPAIPGGASGAAQARMLTYLDYAYPPDWLAKGVATQAGYRYTHWWRSWADARVRGGQSVQQYVDTCKRIQDGGMPFLCHLLRSKDFDAPDVSLDDVNPLLEALLKAGVIHMASPWWEGSLATDCVRYAAAVQHDAAILVPARVIVGVHLQQGYPHFGPDLGPNRTVESAREFWLPCIAAGVKRLFYQYVSVPPWSAGMMQARGNDVSVRLVQGGAWSLPETVLWDGFELVGVPLFENWDDGDGHLANEDTANLKGLETLCTPGPLAPSGFGNGARYPDGSAI